MFIEALDMMPDGEKYLDGLRVARKLGIPTLSPTPSVPNLKVDPKLRRLARKIKG